MSFKQARGIVDFFAQEAEKLPDSPEVQVIRLRMMEEALMYYQSFIDQHEDDPKLQAELTESHARIVSARKQLFSLQGCSQLSLLIHRSVRDDLQLSEDQKRQITELSELLGEQRRQLRQLPPLTEKHWRQEFEKLAQENRERVAKILQPEQAARLAQIRLQWRGPSAFKDPEIVDPLKLTKQQRDQIDEILKESWVGPGRHRHKLDESRKKAGERIQALLTADQRTKWEQMIGQPLKEDIRFGRPDLIEPSSRKGR
jgi:hypothetical protein